MYKKIGDAFDNALKSIYEFKNEINGKGDSKSGIKYEKSLISDNLTKETFNDDEENFLWTLIYPSENNTFYVDDAFGIFVGFEIEVSEKEKMKSLDFRNMIRARINDAVDVCLTKIKTKIDAYGLQGHEFYIYVAPMSITSLKVREIRIDGKKNYN